MDRVLPGHLWGSECRCPGHPEPHPDPLQVPARAKPCYISPWAKPHKKKPPGSQASRTPSKCPGKIPIQPGNTPLRTPSRCPGNTPSMTGTHSHAFHPQERPRQSHPFNCMSHPLPPPLFIYALACVWENVPFNCMLHPVLPLFTFAWANAPGHVSRFFHSKCLEQY